LIKKIVAEKFEQLLNSMDLKNSPLKAHKQKSTVQIPDIIQAP